LTAAVAGRLVPLTQRYVVEVDDGGLAQTEDRQRPGNLGSSDRLWGGAYHCVFRGL